MSQQRYQIVMHFPTEPTPSEIPPTSVEANKQEPEEQRYQLVNDIVALEKGHTTIWDLFWICTR